MTKNAFQMKIIIPNIFIVIIDNPLGLHMLQIAYFLSYFLSVVKQGLKNTYFTDCWTN